MLSSTMERRISFSFHNRVSIGYHDCRESATERKLNERVSLKRARLCKIGKVYVSRATKDRGSVALAGSPKLG